MERGLPRNYLADLLCLLRPQQWIKNSFVVIGLLFSRRWDDPVLVLFVGLLALAFCLAASGLYALNDLMDLESDRQHPEKSMRPLAAGQVSTKLVPLLIILLWSMAFGLASTVSWSAVFILGVYVLLNIGYTLGLKQIAVIDVAVLASGYLSRLLIGTVGVGIEPSQWLLLTGSLVALFLGFAKRRAELIAFTGVHPRRKVLNYYTVELLDRIIVALAAATLLTYGFYTISPQTVETHHTRALIVTLPLVTYGICRYLYLVLKRGAGEDPSRLAVRDPHIAITVVLWLFISLWLIR